jgi:hypothetical protein
LSWFVGRLFAIRIFNTLVIIRIKVLSEKHPARRNISPYKRTDTLAGDGISREFDEAKDTQTTTRSGDRITARIIQLRIPSGE